MTRAVVFLLAFLLAGSPAFADALSLRMEVPGINSDDATVERAMKALYASQGSPEFDEVLLTLQRMADADNAEAAFRLGRYFDIETPVPDYARAISFYEKAAAKGHGFALNNLGLIYERGNGVEKDVKRAYEYFEASAKANDHHGYLNLARMNFEGKELPRNINKGMEWLEDAMNRKVPGSYLDAANIFHGGFFSIPQNRVTALRYLEKAAKSGDEDAAGRIANIYVYGDCDPGAGLINKLKGSDNCIPENPRKGMDMFMSLARRDNREALSSLGSIYWKGIVTPPDAGLAVSYWNRAAELGDCEAMVHLANAYAGGKGIAENDARAIEHFEQAVACNPRDANSLYALGKFYYDEKNPSRDCKKAERLFQRAVANGKREAYNNLGFIYDRGCSPIAEDKKKAFGYYLIGAKLGVAVCQNNIGALLKQGQGVEKDMTKGYAWMQVAAASGSGTARKTLTEYDVLFPQQNRKDGLKYIPAIKEMLAAAKLDPAVAFDGKY